MYTNYLFILILCVLNINGYKQENDDDEEFIDIGVRLTGDNRDYLIADLIAEEKDSWNWFTSFSYSTKTYSEI
jgi:hypothetical protein